MEEYIRMTIDGKRYKAEIVQDNEPLNPREEFDHVCIMACWHRRYDLGDKHEWKSPTDMMCELLFDAGVTDDEGYALDDEAFEERFENGKEDPVALLREKGVIVTELYLYDHSGLTVSTGGFTCRWDSSQIGWVIMTPKRFKEAMGREWAGTPEDIKWAEGCIEAEVEEYDQYLTGDVWGIRIKDEYDEEVESCWGFYGSKYAEEDARRQLEYWDDQEKRPFKGISYEFDQLRDIEANIRSIAKDVHNGWPHDEIEAALNDIANGLRSRRMEIKKRARS